MQEVTCNPNGKALVRALPGYGIRMPETRHPNDVLRAFLDDQGWTQGELAQALDVDPKTVSRWMTGSSKFTDRKLRRVFKQLGIDPKEYGLPPALSVATSDPEEDPDSVWTLERYDALQAQLRNIESKLDMILKRTP